MATPGTIKISLREYRRFLAIENAAKRVIHENERGDDIAGVIFALDLAITGTGPVTTIPAPAPTVAPDPSSVASDSESFVLDPRLG